VQEVAFAGIANLSRLQNMRWERTAKGGYNEAPKSKKAEKGSRDHVEGGSRVTVRVQKCEELKEGLLRKDQDY